MAFFEVKKYPRTTVVMGAGIGGGVPAGLGIGPLAIIHGNLGLGIGMLAMSAFLVVAGLALIVALENHRRDEHNGQLPASRPTMPSDILDNFTKGAMLTGSLMGLGAIALYIGMGIAAGITLIGFGAALSLLLLAVIHITFRRFAAIGQAPDPIPLDPMPAMTN